MNDTNREEGMDRTSNTLWEWTGTGTVRDGSLVFAFAYRGEESRGGSLRREGDEYILLLDRVEYRVHAMS